MSIMKKMGEISSQAKDLKSMMSKPYSPVKYKGIKAKVVSKMSSSGELKKAEKGEKSHTGASDTSLSGKAWNIHDPKGDAKFKSGFEEASRRAKENRMK